MSAAKLDISKPIKAGSQDQDRCESDLCSRPIPLCSLMSSIKSSGSGAAIRNEVKIAQLLAGFSCLISQAEVEFSSGQEHCESHLCSRPSLV